ncbi:MAG: sulfonate transporter [Polyangiaceae bacterium]|jgi:sulfonate transport system permease protein|nr:sulfonate transporter [Polyangiaceae bacterium]
MSQLEAPFDIASGARETPTSPQSPAVIAKKPLKARPSLIGWIVPTALLFTWAVASHKEWVAPQILPAPAAVAQTLLDQVKSGELFVNFAISLGRVAGGVVFGGLIGVVLGVAMGLSRRVEQYLYTFFNAISQVPVLGWLPLAMMVLGIGESLKVVIIAHAALVPIAINTLKGIRNVPVAYLDVARSFQFSKRQLLRKVVFPASVPAVFVGIRYGLTQAWLSLVTVELLASSEGLGFLIVWGRQLFQLDLVLSAIIVVGVVGLVLDKGIEKLESRLLRWRPTGSFGSEGQAS